MLINLQAVEEAAKTLYIRALKMLPPDIKQGFERLQAAETGATAQRVLATMVHNIVVAEATDNLLCQDTGIPIYNVWIGRDVAIDGQALRPPSAAAASAPRENTRCAARWCIHSHATTSTVPAAPRCR